MSTVLTVFISTHSYFSYALTDGASFVEQARGATFDLTGDEGVANRQRRTLNWDKKKKKFVKGAGEGADNVKMVRTENGTKLPATYRSGRFDEWKAKTRVSVPKIGEAENESTAGKRSGPGGQRWRHNKIVPAKPLSKLSTDYERKVRQQKKKGEAEGTDAPSSSSRPSGGQRGGRFGGRNVGKTTGRVKAELKTVDQVRKNRKVLENRRAKNGRGNHHQKQKNGKRH